MVTLTLSLKHTRDMAFKSHVDVESSNLSSDFSQLSLKDANELRKNDISNEESRLVEENKDKGSYIVLSSTKASPLACKSTPLKSAMAKHKKNRKTVFKHVRFSLDELASSSLLQREG